MKRSRFVNFKETSKSVSIRKDNKTLKVNPNITGALWANSAKSGKVIDTEKVLMNPLSQIPLNISNGDRTRCVTSKSKLLQCIRPARNETVQPPIDIS